MDTSDPIPRKKCKRYDVPGHSHYMTFSCLRRQPFLARDRCRDWFCHAVELARAEHPFCLWAFVIMPEHAHLLIQPVPGTQISKILQTLKQSVTQKAHTWLLESGCTIPKCMQYRRPDGSTGYRFWQPGGGYDRNEWSLREILEKVEYIHQNPVRRGLVGRPDDWVWSSWAAWRRQVDEPLRIDRQSLPWA